MAPTAVAAAVAAAEAAAAAVAAVADRGRLRWSVGRARPPAAAGPGQPDGAAVRASSSCSDPADGPPPPAAAGRG